MEPPTSASRGDNLAFVSRPRRLDAFSYLGPYRYFLTCCCRLRRRSFEISATVDETVDCFLIAAASEGFAVLAYCLMPDHAHWLVEGTTDAADFRQFVKMAKQRSGAAFAARHRAALWQEGYYERVLRNEESSRDVARYIVENPVRAGIVANARAYPSVGSGVWSVA